MKKALTVLAAAGMAAAMVGSASAADIPMMPTVVAPVAPAAPPAPEFSFAGPYFGAHGGITFQWCGDGFCREFRSTNFGLHGGYNVVFGPAVVGLEVRTGLIFNNNQQLCDSPFRFCSPYSDLNLHVGAVIGERTLVYGIAGLGMAWWYTQPYLNLGLGVEFLVTPDIGVFGQIMHSSEPFSLAPADRLGIVLQVGVNLH